VLDGGLVAVTMQFETTEVRCAHADLARSGSARRAGREMAEALGPDTAAVFVLVDGVSVNGTALADGIADVLPGVPVSGGFAADGERFERTWTIVDGQPVQGHATAVGFSGPDLDVGFGSAAGWVAFGPDRLVTRSFGNVLYELDGRRASDLYLEYLGSRAEALPAAGWLLPVAITDLDGRTVVRCVREVHESEGSLTFVGDVPQGATARLMHSSIDGVVQAAELASKRAASGAERVALAVSSAGRRVVLGEHAADELDLARHVLADGTTLVGFYGYGELAPGEGCNDVHDLTMSVTTLGERSNGGRSW
jgi:hypothetical protein